MENIIYNEMRYRRFLVDVGNVNIRVRNEKGELQRVRTATGDIRG